MITHKDNTKRHSLQIDNAIFWLLNRIADKIVFSKWSYSTISCFQSGPAFRRMMSRQTRVDRMTAAAEANKIVERSIQSVYSHRFKYIMFSFLIVLLLVKILNILSLRVVHQWRHIIRRLRAGYERRVWRHFWTTYFAFFNPNTFHELNSLVPNNYTVSNFVLKHNFKTQGNLQLVFKLL